MRLTYEWDETGGYDCITPAFVIRDERQKVVVVVDMKDFGWEDAGLGHTASESKERARARALAITRLICAAPIMRDSLALIEELSANALYRNLNATSAVAPINKAAQAGLLAARGGE